MILGHMIGNALCCRLETKSPAYVNGPDPEQFLPKSHIQEIRGGLRRQLREGVLDNKSYQQRLVQARRKVEARQREIWHLEEKFFKANFPMIVPVGTREEVLAILRSPA
jgi:hypothetical protein